MGVLVVSEGGVGAVEVEAVVPEFGWLGGEVGGSGGGVGWWRWREWWLVRQVFWR